MRLRYRKRASCLHDRWIGIEFVNETGRPVPLRGIQFHFDHDLIGRSGGGLFNSNAAVLPPVWRDLRHEPVILAPGVTRLWGALSGLASARLPLAASTDDRLRLRVAGHFQVDDGSEHHNGCVEVEMSWMPVGEEGIAALRQRLDDLLDAPRGSSAPVNRIAAWLRKPEVCSHLDAERLIAALERRRPGSVARAALARHLAQRFGDARAVRRHFLERLQAGDLDALADLSRSWDGWSRPADGIWSPEYIEAITRLIEKTTDAWGIGFSLLDTHGTPQADNERLATRLSTAVLARDVLSRPQGHPGDTWPRYPDGFTFLARCRDPRAIQMLVPQLTDLSVQRSIKGYPRGWSFPVVPDGGWRVRPPPSRTCDFALEAILLVQGQDLREAYEEAGFADLRLRDTSATDEDNVRAIGEMRDRMIAALRRELAR